MTIEAAHSGDWPPPRRYLGFVAMTVALLLFGLVIFALFTGSFYGLDGITEPAQLILFWGLTFCLPIGLLAVFLGLWMFRHLFAVLAGRGWPVGLVVPVVSALVFCVAGLGAGWIVFVDEGPYMAQFFQVVGVLSLWVVPVAALSGWLLLRPARGQDE